MDRLVTLGLTANNRRYNMPELPEVETMKRILKKELVGLTFKEVNISYARHIQMDPEEFTSKIIGQKILSFSRKGKYLIFNLTSDLCMIVHFRMEGRFYFVEELEPNLTPYVHVYFKLDNGKYLLYSDSRKFGVIYLENNKDIYDRPPLSNVGKEPWDIKNADYLLEQYKNKSYVIKLGLLDQTVIAGLGNIYADEVLFRSKVSPFKLARNLTYQEAERLLKNSIDILDEAIERGGSTIRTYHPAQGVSGKMQLELQAYGRENRKCFVCGTKMEKRYVGGRGTTYCPKCQHVCPSVALTGKIASGKSQVLSRFKDLGCEVKSADAIVHEFYTEPVFLSNLQKKFPMVFKDGKIDKQLIIENMLADKKFRRSYETYVWAAVKDYLNTFLINNYDKVCVVEIPLLFKANMEKKFTYTIGVETNKQRDYLVARNGKNIERHLEINDASGYDENRCKLDFIVENNSSLDNLFEQVDNFYQKIIK
jgi:formamidopyrimidine-DNA glycosylase